MEARGELSVGSCHSGFMVTKVESVPEVDAVAYVFRHDDTGARLLWLARDDSACSLTVAFKTPPFDNSGVFHVLERAVGHGGGHGPGVHPFEAARRSLGLTGMGSKTEADRTVFYGTAPTGDVLEGLTKTLLNAVFYPAFLHDPSILAEEGCRQFVGPQTPWWRYGRLGYEGAAYREAYEASRSVRSRMEQALSSSLFPNTCYGFDPNGLLEGLPLLSQDALVRTYERHYTPSNCYLVLCGNADIERELALVGSLLPSDMDQNVGDSHLLELQNPVRAPLQILRGAGGPRDGATGLALVIGDTRDYGRVFAFEHVLVPLLANCGVVRSNELRRSGILALSNAVGNSALGTNLTLKVRHGLQPALFVELFGCETNKHATSDQPTTQQKLTKLVHGVCEQFCDKGFSESLLQEYIGRAEGERLHAIAGAAGTMLGDLALSTWLYDDSRPVDALRFTTWIAFMNEQAAGEKEAPYFARLLRDVVLKSRHRTAVEFVPAAEDTDPAYARRAQMARRRAALSMAQLGAMEQLEEDPEEQYLSGAACPSREGSGSSVVADEPEASICTVRPHVEASAAVARGIHAKGVVDLDDLIRSAAEVSKDDVPSSRDEFFADGPLQAGARSLVVASRASLPVVSWLIVMSRVRSQESLQALQAQNERAQPLHGEHPEDLWTLLERLDDLVFTEFGALKPFDFITFADFDEQTKSLRRLPSNDTAATKGILGRALRHQGIAILSLRSDSDAFQQGLRSALSADPNDDTRGDAAVLGDSDTELYGGMAGPIAFDLLDGGSQELLTGYDSGETDEGNAPEEAVAERYESEEGDIDQAREFEQSDDDRAEYQDAPGMLLGTAGEAGFDVIEDPDQMQQQDVVEYAYSEDARSVPQVERRGRTRRTPGSRSSRLSQEEEVLLAKRIERGRAAQAALSAQNAGTPELGDAQARHLRRLTRRGNDASSVLVRSHLWLVRYLVSRSHLPHSGFVKGDDFLKEDYLAAGNLGLCKAVEKFDYRRGRFSAYARQYINKEIKRLASEQSLPLHMGQDKFWDVNRMLRVKRDISAKLDKEPSDQIIAAAVNEGFHPTPPWTAEKVAKLRIIEEGPKWRSAASLDQPMNEDGDDSSATVGDTVAEERELSPEEAVQYDLLCTLLYAALYSPAGLSDLEREVILRYYGLDGPGNAGAYRSLGNSEIVSVDRYKTLAGNPESDNDLVKSIAGELGLKTQEVRRLYGSAKTKLAIPRVSGGLRQAWEDWWRVLSRFKTEESLL